MLRDVNRHPIHRPIAPDPHMPVPTRNRWARRACIAAVPTLLATVGLVSTAAAHDFWIIPDIFTAPNDAALHFSGRAGTRFPAGTAVQPNRVADARLIGASSQTKITEMSVEGTSLRLHQKPPAAGQYIVAVTLTSNPTRSTAAGMLRFLKGEGGAAEAGRLEHENALAGQDSLVYHATSYAEAIVEVGRGGPRAFATSSGLPLEFVPVNDPSHLHEGDTLHVKVVGLGKSIPNVGIFAGPAADTSAGAAGGGANTSLSLLADNAGVVHLPLTKAGAWNLRAAYVSKGPGGAANEWTISRTTYVFGVSAKH